MRSHIRRSHTRRKHTTVSTALGLVLLDGKETPRRRSRPPLGNPTGHGIEPGCWLNSMRCRSRGLGPTLRVAAPNFAFGESHLALTAQRMLPSVLLKRPSERTRANKKYPLNSSLTPSMSHRIPSTEVVSQAPSWWKRLLRRFMFATPTSVTSSALVSKNLWPWQEAKNISFVLRWEGFRAIFRSLECKEIAYLVHPQRNMNPKAAHTADR